MAFDPYGSSGTADEIDQRRALAQSLMMQAQQPAGYWTQGLANIGNSLIAGFEMGRANKEYRQNDDANAARVASWFKPSEQEQPPAIAASSVATALASPQSSPTSPDIQNAVSDQMADDYFARLKKAESGGNLVAKALTSSATGPYQFTDGTWRGVMQQHPDLGLTLDGRTDPKQADAAVRALSSDNLAYMLQHGVQNPTDGQQYLAHFAGAPAASRIIQADPSTPVSSLLSSAQINANPFLRGMDAQGVQNWANGRIGAPVQQQPTSMPQATSPQPAPTQNMAPQTGPATSDLYAALADPSSNQQTRSVAASLLQQRMEQDNQARQIQMKQADPLYQAQLAEYGARTSALQQKMNAPSGAGYSLLPPQQAQAMGLDPKKAYQVGPDGKIGEIGNSGVNVTLNNGPTTSEFQKKSDDAAAVRLGGYIQEGSAAPALIGQLQQLSDLSHSIGTGKGAQFMANVGPYVQALGVDVKGLDQTQVFNAIVDRMAPQMRPVGSGSSSDTDVRMFMNSLPRLGNTDRGNQIIAGTMQALEQNKVQAADIASQAQRGQISWQDAETQIRKLPNPYEQFRGAHADLLTNAPTPSAPQSGQNRTTTGVVWSVH